ncbi:VOC family protein [Halomarina halobia]|uniref:VOC family protein n=1 Tax=Halomarina halobia TaxID=3033386 RepID=A0ABD6ACM0_9EURY|nr:VOC family protein [Halomarina sp. PSR21]
MGIRGLHHLVLLVDDVPDGEAFYRELFDMEVLFREGVLDGTVGTVPDGVGWDEAISKGATPTMSFLGRDEFFLAVAQADGEPSAGRVDHVALAVDEPAFEAITDRAESVGCEVEQNAAHHRILRDAFGMEWELNANPPPPSRAFEPLDI